uniref:Uncharacterized protein n=1 Tax=Populus alba TaxID=43335 RepID=A0A4U5NNX0_POPAL|nr:hypothetical protein D5086_0000254940 [Populus alba]
MISVISIFRFSHEFLAHAGFLGTCDYELKLDYYNMGFVPSEAIPQHGMASQGIQCVGGHVTGISLERMGLDATSIDTDAFLFFSELTDNYLKGSIPESNHSSFRVFNVSSNDLNGSIPKTHTLQSFGPDSCSSNPQLCGPPALNTCNNVSTAVDGAADHNNTNSPPDEPPRTSSKPKSATTFILLDVAGLAAVILLFIFLL